VIIGLTVFIHQIGECPWYYWEFINKRKIVSSFFILQLLRTAKVGKDKWKAHFECTCYVVAPISYMVNIGVMLMGEEGDEIHSESLIQYFDTE
jgi:hypothetical protein